MPSSPHLTSFLIALIAFMLTQACRRQPPPASAPVASGSTNLEATTTAARSTNAPTPQQAEAFLRTLSHPLSREEVNAVVRLLAQTDMPANATEVFGFSRKLFTEGIDIRFTCPPDELHAFLTASPHLSDDLRTSERRLLLRQSDSL